MTLNVTASTVGYPNNSWAFC